ncbi:MAG: DUF5716 family protein [Acholeplasmatales bacterium]|jgi:hypothetical protein|nr:DUF5716 family protein [Acholeplasmatales bacterium]
MAHLLDIVGENFFSILSSKNKRIYIECILVTYDLLESSPTGFSALRDDVIKRLIDYFDDIDTSFEVEGDTLLEEDMHTSRQKANIVYNALKRSGWVGEEDLGNYKVSVNFFDYSIKMIDCLNSIIYNTNDEYTGDLFSIYTLLNHGNTSKESVGAIEQAYKKTHQLLLKLRSLNANIYRFYFEMLKKHTKKDLPYLMNKLMVDYKDNFFDAAYYNLKTKDSLPRYKRGILNSITSLKTVETMDSIAKSCMREKRISDYNEAFSYVEDKLNYIENKISTLDQVMSSIDKKNEQYVTSAVAKIKFFTNTTDDFEGYYSRFFNFLKKVSDSEINWNDIVRITSIRNLDDNSLFSPRRIREELEIGFINDPPEITEEDMEQDEERLRHYQTYSEDNINEIIKKKLENRDSFMASDLDLETDNDILTLVLVYVYSHVAGMDYHIKTSNDFVEKNNVRFKEFEIIKGGYTDD